MKVYLDNTEINFTDLAITNFRELLELQVKLKHVNNLEFSSIKQLKGDKELLNKAFKDTFFESITD